ncbi:hypothetical protein DFP92_101862 [Yoonia sediminilitoris]|uniref:Uncharacterized protein n=1 Tax=Yoonia sediminilitoris TaxID=1286148 RepID=A0A2T6KRU9_9RHOB|nr:hypothetical protein C8N45_101862 [Yoonia sediminilitoris]RCW99435.1 hypothetical protein DFP92_101862 [Yoonia sediminilitoris]
MVAACFLYLAPRQIKMVRLLKRAASVTREGNAPRQQWAESERFRPMLVRLAGHQSVLERQNLTL